VESVDQAWSYEEFKEIEYMKGENFHFISARRLFERGLPEYNYLYNLVNYQVL